MGIKRYMSAYIQKDIDINLTYESEHIFDEYTNITNKLAKYQSIAKSDNNKYSTNLIK